jgi:hypothetical protein
VQEGTISDFSVEHFEPDSLFQRLGTGSLGGKARGLAFLNLMLTSPPYHGRLGEMRVEIPQSFVIATEYFDKFLEENDLHEFAYTCADDAAINRRFLGARLPARVMDSLEKILEHLQCPLAVRSSSLLEDDMSHPFAGIYNTLMLANNSPNPLKRLVQLSNAVKIVYASTFHANAKAYIENTGHRIEQEKMAVVIERVVGQPHDTRFYPHFAGVAQSYNYYPLGPQKAEDGVAQMALGLGRMVVDGGHAFRFSPRHPDVLPQLATPSAALEHSQSRFYALDLDAGGDDPSRFGLGHLRIYDLAAAESDGTLPTIGSRYDANNDVLVEGGEAKGPWLITFRNLLKYQSVPLAQALRELLDLAAAGMGCAVEIEFACDLGDDGRPARGTRREPVLFALQLRPIVTKSELLTVTADKFDAAAVICRSQRAMGHGSYADLRDIVYVKHQGFNPANTPAIAREVGQLNQRLAHESRPFVLIGPGRWGSSDNWLGIPVNWAQISGARVIIEASPAGYFVDPSQGTHFFHNITSLGIGYFTIPPGAVKNGEDAEFVDWEWLNRQPAAAETEFLRHVHLPQPLVVVVDGRKGLGIIAEPTDTHG